MSQPRGLVPRGLGDPVWAECILTLYKQVPNSFAAAITVTIFMGFTAWPYSSHAAVIVWLVVQALSQVARLVLFLAYRRLRPGPEHLQPWAHFYSAYMLAAGLIWGATIFLFTHPDQPITLALTLCGLYGISAGSVPGNAYNLPGCYAFVVTIFALVLAKMLMVGDFGHIVLGLASALFALIMVLFARVQNRTFRDGFDIRFENIELLKETRLAQMRAEAANLAKSQFLAAASHDLRQPLYALSLFSGSLKNFALDDDGHDLVRKIQDNIAAMETLFNGLLDLSRLEAGAVKTDIRPFAVQPLFARLEHYFAPLARAQGLRITFGRTALWVTGDEVLSEQILMNLIANALRYTPSGRIVVAARRQGNRVALQVSDTGKGIDAADQKRIFDEFVQVGNTERDRSKGLGLGLAIASRTAHLLDSRIELRSQPGKGSRFAFALPRADAQGTPVRVAAAPTADLTASLRVLIVDDDQAVRDALDRLLGGWGLDFTIAAGLDEARAALDGPPFSVVLCDYRLREGAVGLDFLSDIKGTDRPGHKPGLCLITGDVDAGLMKRAQAAGIFLIHKPVDPARLRALLNHLASR